ncbi:MAG: TCP-1/cpn60 chaperonin family protein, partial [Candidatus Nanoarchaeia archaeon]
MGDVLSKGSTRSNNMSALESNVLAARVVSDIVRSTLGPMGMDKLLVDAQGRVVITNDGATILREMSLEHPAARMMVEVARAQEVAVGDGPQPLYSKVLTPDGFVLMGSLKVGDVVCGTGLSSQRVLGVFPKGVKRVYKVCFSDGSVVECCEDHLWCVKNCEGISKVVSTRQLFADLTKWDTPYYTPI